MEESMPINRNAYDREEDELVRQVNASEISQKEFDRAMRDMRDEIRAYAEGKRPKYPSLPGLVACEADQFVPFQESTRWQGPPTPSSMRFGAIVFAASRRAV
jgi:hypothetical protein